ncbi:hypothetical protein VTI74DRAFT_3046 [Chaetomium olivicolor]
MAPTVTSIGIGNMGAALASVLLDSSVPLTIWNRTADRPHVKSLITRGAHFEPSFATAVSHSAFLLICLFDYSAIYSALKNLPEGDTKPLAGKTIINVTNGTPREARKMEADLKALGAEAYFDGGIMVTPQLVGTATSFVILSGETEQAYQERIAELLKPIGALQYVSEDAGAASLYDVAALAAMYGMFMGAFTGIALLKKQRQVAGKDEGKADATPAVNGVMVPMLTALVPYVSLLAERVDQEAWMDDLGNPLAMQDAGVRNILQACEEEGVDGRGLKFLFELMEKAVRDGFGQGGVAAIAQYLFK